MKVNVLGILLDYEGKPKSDGENQDLTWRSVFYNALNSIAPNEVQTAEEKQKSYQLTLKIYQHNEIDLTLDDQVFILKRVEKIYNPLVCGRTAELFDNKESKVE